MPSKVRPLFATSAGASENPVKPVILSSRDPELGTRDAGAAGGMDPAILFAGMSPGEPASHRMTPASRRRRWPFSAADRVADRLQMWDQPRGTLIVERMAEIALGGQSSLGPSRKLR
jgi:hypothetical protein